MDFGAHVSISGGVFHAPQNGKDACCDVVQIFTKNQMQWKVPELTDEDILKFKQERERIGVNVACVHASYLINLGGFDRTKLKMSRDNFLTELKRAEALEIPYLVVHPGSHLGKGEEAGLAKIAESLNVVMAKCPDFKVKILLETTAGQGTNLGYKFEHLADIREKVEEQSRIGICIDTCHIFAAGYDLRSKPAYETTMQELDAIIGAQDVGVIHANDSKKPLGSRLDRHAHIGDGELGLSAFENLVNDTRFQNVPKIIETPGGPQKDCENLAKLRSLIQR